MGKKVLGMIASLSSVLLLLLLAACSGGGGGVAGDSSKSTLKGMIEFPEAATSKLTAKLVDATDVTIEVYDLKGTLVVPAVTPQYEDTLATRKYEFQVPNLPSGIDYVLKAKKGQQVVKRIVAREDVKPGVIAAQNVDKYSTTAVVMAEQKLSSAVGVPVKLGDALPATVTIESLSTKLGVVKPAALEMEILNLSLTTVASLDTQAKADLVNMLSMVEQAVKNSVDASAFVKGEAATTVHITVNIIVVAGGTATSESRSVSSSDAVTTAASAVTAYTPPNTTGGTVAVADYVTPAMGYLNKQDVANASIYFERALTADPTNKDAIFGAGITRLIMLTEDPDVRDVVTKWGGVAPMANDLVSRTSPAGNPFKNFSGLMGKAAGSSTIKTAAKAPADSARATAAQVIELFNALTAKLPKARIATKSNPKVVASVPTTAPSIADMQKVVDNKLIPKLNESLLLLASLEGKSYTFTVTKAMQGNPLYGKDITLNDGEIYALEAVANGALALLKISTAYNLDVFDYNGDSILNDYDKVQEDPLKTLNQASFLTLKSDGKAKMAAALEYVKAARDKAELAYNTVKSRTAGQGAFDISSWTTQDHANTAEVLAKVKAALAGPYTLTQGTSKQIAMDVTKFFTNPLDRSDLPTLGYDVAPDATLSAKYHNPVAGERQEQRYDWNGTTNVATTVTMPTHSDIVPKSDLPDYTLNGILPNNTAANNVAGFNGILPVLDGKLLTGNSAYGYNNVVTDGTDLYALAYMGMGKNDIQKINVATAAVTTYASPATTATYSDYIQRLIMYNGSLYDLRTQQNYNPTTGTSSTNLQLMLITVTGGSYTVGTTPAATLPLSSNNWISCAVGAGNQIYYLLGKYNDTTHQYTNELHRLTDLTTDTVLFTTTDGGYSLALYNNFLYLNQEKYDLSGNSVGRYMNMDADVIVGGYFYSLHDGKLVKSAGTPSGSAAKLLSRFF